MRLNVTYDGEKFCAQIPLSSIIIFPVLLTNGKTISIIKFLNFFFLYLFFKKDWETRDSMFVDHTNIQKVLFFVSALMFLIFAVSMFVVICYFFGKLKLR